MIVQAAILPYPIDEDDKSGAIGCQIGLKQAESGQQADGSPPR
jgi:hypothetical protein